MIKAKHNRMFIWFFRSYFRLLQKLYFRKMRLLSDVAIPDHQSVLLLQNHFSWWDGYWSYKLSQKIFKRRFHVMMLEEQLIKRKFLNSCGIFTIRKNHRDFINSLQYSSELLADPNNLVTIYPSGELFSQHWQSIPFQRGINYILNNAPDHIAIVLAVVLTDYFSNARPEIRIYVENYTGEKTAKAIENAYHSFYHSCTLKQME